MRLTSLIIWVFLSKLYAIPVCQETHLSTDDAIQIEGDAVYLVPEFWNRFQKGGKQRPRGAVLYSGSRNMFQRRCYQDRMLIGSYAEGSLYVVISDKRRVHLGGLRLHCQKTFSAGWDSKKRLKYLNKILRRLSLEYQVDIQSSQVSLFFDGTGSFGPNTFTNIYRDYLAHSGSRFYYPGVGNFEENNVYGIIAGAGWADPNKQFFPVINQAYKDLLSIANQSTGTVQVYFYGMSRGAAQAVELAKMLQERPIENIEISFLGLYEPVYSVGFLRPGQSSMLVEHGDVYANWTKAQLPNNVKQVAILYGRHEERTWFSAAFFDYDKSKTILDIGILSGSHGSICGPRVKSRWQPALHVMARSWMAERAALAHAPRKKEGVLNPVVNDLCCALTSGLVQALNWDYDDFGAGAIQSNQGINLQWLTDRLLPWHWGSKAPLKDKYKRDFTPLLSGLYQPNIVY